MNQSIFFYSIAATVIVHCACGAAIPETAVTPGAPSARLVSPKSEAVPNATGAEWRPALAEARFERRYGYALVVFRDRLWLIGGKDFKGLRSDVWSSGDGVNWELATATAAFSPRYYCEVVAHENKLWLLGGRDGEGANPRCKNDVWCSENGADWTLVTPSAGFSPRWLHKALAYQDRLWVTCGLSGNAPMNDVWCSVNGHDWTQVTPAAAFSGRQTPGFIGYAGKLWLIAGADGRGNTNEVWSSPDGAVWNQVTVNARFPVRHAPAMLIHENRLWMIGGVNTPGVPDEFRTDTWSTTDGVDWSREDPADTFPGGLNPKVAVLHGEVWAVGGLRVVDGKPVLKNDIWHLHLKH